MLLRKFFLTVCFSGLSPKAPGTVGSFVSLILGLLLLQYISNVTLFLITILISVIAVKQIDKYEEKIGVHDSKEIVIDELSGMWITLCICEINDSNIFIMAIFAFIYFRIFDIWKPSIIGKIDKNVKGGWGVMGDDMVAGIFAGICTSATSYILSNIFF